MTEQDTGSVPQTSLLQKVEALNYHNYQLLINPKHKQSDTIKHFKDQNTFPISRSSLNRWIANEVNIREECLKLSDKTKGKTKTRRPHNPTTGKLLKFFENDKVMKCLKAYYLQYLVVQPDIVPLEKELRTSYKEIKQLFDAEDLGNDVLLDESSWPHTFMQFLEPQVESIKQNLAQQSEIQKVSKSLLAERNRLRNTLRGYKMSQIYQFNELLFNINNLYDLTDFNNDKIYTNPVDNDNLTGDIRTNKTITLGICCNLDGSDFIDPLLISNLTNSKNMYKNNSTNEYFYNPEGLNTREILRDFLTTWNTKLSIEGKKIALVLDTYLCHYGLLYEFSNIEFVFLNSKFDKTTSYYHRTQLKLPFSFGLERLVKYKLKLSLFKKFYKRNIPLNRFDGIDIINNIKTNYSLIIEAFRSEKYKLFLQLGVTASRIIDEIENADEFENEDLPSQIMDGNININKTISQAKEKDKPFNKLSNYINSIIPEKYSSIHFSEIHKVLILKDEEKQLLNFVRTITKSIIESNPGEELNYRQLQQNILHEFTIGHNEKKYNQPYSLNGIVTYVKLDLEHQILLKSLYETKALSSDFKQELRIDSFLLNTVQPFLSKFSHRPVLDHNAVTQLHIGDLINISPETMNLFNQFYISYVNDTTIIKPKLNPSKRQLKLNESEKKRFKLRELISDDSDESENELDSNLQQRKNSVISNYSLNSLSSRYRDNFSDSD